MPNIDSSGNYVQSRINNQDLIKQVKNLNKTIEGKKKAFNIIKIQKASIENELLAISFFPNMIFFVLIFYYIYASQI
jgi:hypothetical protein